MIVGVYNDNTPYESTTNVKFVKFRGDIDLISKEVKSSEQLERYSRTFRHDSIRINDIIQQRVGRDIRLIDGTTSIGGNFLEFIRTFRHCIGIELNRDRYLKLTENILALDAKPVRRFRVNNYYIYRGNTVHTVNASFTDVYKKFIKTGAVVVFLDPPWGGKEYKNYDKILFGLAGRSLAALIRDIKKINPEAGVCLKLPQNYYLESLREFKYSKYPFERFLIVYI